MNHPISQKQIHWGHIFFFGATALLALIATPAYVYNYGISLSEGLLFAFYVAATGLSITVGYHRLYAHASFQAHPLIEFFVLFFGAAAFEQSALKWSAQHRLHHQYVDTDKDPYNIKKGFFYAHMGWILFWKQEDWYNNVRDLKKKKILMHQHKYYRTWAIATGILLPLLIGALTGHLLGAFLITVCFRLALVHHSTFSINSVCHMFGKATYDINASAKDHWLVAFLTNGEGYHNFHHRFPTDYRNGVRWYQWDPSKWVISALAVVGLTSKLRRVSRFRILEARLSAEKQKASVHLSAEILNVHYQQLKQTLSNWDHAIKQYKENLSIPRKIALQEIKQAKYQFKEAYAQWLDLQRGFQLSA